MENNKQQLVWTKKNELTKNDDVDQKKFDDHFPTLSSSPNFKVVKEKELLVTPDVIYYKENEKTVKEEKAMRYVCKLFLNNGVCKRRGCKFAHNLEELHAPCRLNKKCRRPNCQFYHTSDTFDEYLDRLRASSNSMSASIVVS